MTTATKTPGEETMRSSFSRKIALFATAVSALVVVACGSTAVFNGPTNVKAVGGLHEITLTWDTEAAAALHIDQPRPTARLPYTDPARKQDTTHILPDLAHGAKIFYLGEAGRA